MRGTAKITKLTARYALANSSPVRRSSSHLPERIISVKSRYAVSEDRSLFVPFEGISSRWGSGSTQDAEFPFASTVFGSVTSDDMDPGKGRCRERVSAAGMSQHLAIKESIGGHNMDAVMRRCSSCVTPDEHLEGKGRAIWTHGRGELDQKSLPQCSPPRGVDTWHAVSGRMCLGGAHPWGAGPFSRRHVSPSGASWPSSLSHSAGLHTDRGSENAASGQSSLDGQSLLGEQGSASQPYSMVDHGALADQAQSLTEAVGSVSHTLATAVGEVAAIADQHWLPTVMLQEVIEAVHIYGGLPWWAAIAATTVGIRLLLFPVAVYQMKLTAGLAKVKPEIERLLAKVKESGYNPQVVDKYQKETRALYRKHKTNPFAPIGGAVFQGSTFVFFFFAIQGMAKGVESFATGGALWFVDLTTPDDLYIFPVMTALSFMVQVELGAVEGMEGQPNAALMKNLFRLFGLAMVPLTATFPKALFCYWLTTNLCSLTQASLFKLPAVRKTLGLPPRPGDMAAAAETAARAGGFSNPPKMFARPPPRARIEASQNKGQNGPSLPRQTPL